jgi:chemosensory pili system protein ChpA (sensor histidine kinase/response regulator)
MSTASGERTIGSHGRQAATTEKDDRANAPILYVVDDDVPTLELLREVARESGWRTVGFTRLAPLRAALAERRPTLVIIDDDLPDGRGGDLARDLRGDARLEDVPLLVCTGAPPRRQAEIVRWAPVVAKPFELDEIEEFLAAAARGGGDGHAYGETAG